MCCHHSESHEHLWSSLEGNIPAINLTITTHGIWNLNRIEITASIEQLKKFEGDDQDRQPITNFDKPDVTTPDEFLEDICDCQGPSLPVPVSVTFIDAVQPMQELKDAPPPVSKPSCSQPEWGRDTKEKMEGN